MELEKIIKSTMLTQEKNSKDIKLIFDVIFKTFETLSEIDTTGIDPSDFPYDIKKTFLREDKIGQTFESEFKQNINTNEENFVVLKGAKDE